jgi:hypothetical protein
MRHFPNQTFICKPSRGRGGEGISLVRKFSDLPKAAFTHEFLIQRYIENPLLIAGKKFDLRVYVVIKGVNRIECYICEEGIARFCTVSQHTAQHLIFFVTQIVAVKLQEAGWAEHEEYVYAFDKLQLKQELG